MYEIIFLVLENKTQVSKSFDSEYKARKFVNKLKHSKKCRLLSYPLFRW